MSRSVLESSDPSPMPTGISTRRSSADGRSVTALRGDVDTHAVPSTADRLAAAIANSDGDLVVELGDVTFMDSAGLRVLARAAQFLDWHGRQLTLRSPSAAVLRLFQFYGFTHLVEPIL